ncbi:hypothetical protein N9W34_07105, partial [Rickettsiales bacterium]|nr:hypothetical protein [Rickettsiales bacterium]
RTAEENKNLKKDSRILKHIGDAGAATEASGNATLAGLAAAGNGAAAVAQVATPIVEGAVVGAAAIAFVAEAVENDKRTSEQKYQYQRPMELISAASNTLKSATESGAEHIYVKAKIEIVDKKGKKHQETAQEVPMLKVVADKIDQTASRKEAKITKEKFIRLKYSDMYVDNEGNPCNLADKAYDDVIYQPTESLKTEPKQDGRFKAAATKLKNAARAIKSQRNEEPQQEVIKDTMDTKIPEREEIRPIQRMGQSCSALEEIAKREPNASESTLKDIGRSATYTTLSPQKAQSMQDLKGERGAPAA